MIYEQIMYFGNQLLQYTIIWPYLHVRTLNLFENVFEKVKEKMKGKLREAILHMGLTLKVILIKLFLDHSCFGNPKGV